MNLQKRGDTLLINGKAFDPSAYDASLPQNSWIVGEPTQLKDSWYVTIILPHAASAPRATRFPEAIIVSADGPVELPPYEGPDEDEGGLRVAVTAKLSERDTHETTSDKHDIKIPKPFTLSELPEGVYFGETASPFERFPKFGAVVAHVIGTASLIDLEILRVAVGQHGGGSLLAIETAFKMLKNDKDKSHYSRLFAERTGRPLVWQTIKWAHDFSKPVYDIRNAFAHRIWGDCPAIPNALLLADPADRLNGHAAFSQLLGHRQIEEEMQILVRIATGQGGSKLSEADAKAILEMAVSRQNAPSRIKAFDMTFGNPMDFRAPAAEVWTANDFKNAALAANIARIHIVERLQKISEWLNGSLTEEELEPLPEKPSKKERR
ncbi:hypothetical protein [Agrobacterium rosae]|uniref:hypothetical protein n=1 Tax=Agrobacterium rosae TaxID=1972867 RepID=UPI003BA105E1